VSDAVCALWVWRYSRLTYELYDSEKAAAGAALATEDYGFGSVAGVQFADGRVVPREDWPAYREAEEAACAASLSLSQVVPPAPVMRRALDPFGSGTEVRVFGVDPPWVGSPV
jgi:hypothetical protein